MSASKKNPKARESTRDGSAGPPEASTKLPDAIRLALDAIEDLKAVDTLVLDVREVASYTDHLIICTGTSDRHAQAIVDGVLAKLRAADVTPLHTEGYKQAAWVLVDYVDFLVNVFTAEAREFYQLERVWRDAPALVGERLELPSGDSSDAGDAPGPDAAADTRDPSDALDG